MNFTRAVVKVHGNFRRKAEKCGQFLGTAASPRYLKIAYVK